MTEHHTEFVAGRHTQFKVKHPLNDKTVLSIWRENADYQLTVKTLTRAGADWQLEQVLNWLESELGRDCYLVPEGFVGSQINVGYVVKALKEAMRPQEGK